MGRADHEGLRQRLNMSFACLATLIELSSF